MSVSNRIKNVGLGIALVCGVITGATQTASASQVSASDGLDHLNETLQDIALLHSMKRDACFKMAGIQGKDFGSRMTLAVDAFNRSLDRIRESQKATGSNQDLAAQMATFEADWATFSAALQQVAAGDYHMVPIRQILTLEPKAQQSFNVIRRTYERSSGTSRSAEVQRLTPIFEQEIRVQKFTKEACLVVRSIDADANLAALLKTTQEFDAANLRAMASPVSDQEHRQLKALKSTMDQFNDLLTKLQGRETANEATKLQLSMLSDALISQLHDMETQTPAQQTPVSNSFLETLDQ